MSDLTADRDDQILDAIHDLLPQALPGARVAYAVRNMARVVTVVFPLSDDGPRQEFRITVEDVT